MPGQGALVGLTAKLGLDMDDREVDRETSGLKDKIEQAIDESEGAPSADTSDLVDDIMAGIEDGVEGSSPTGMFDQEEFERISEQFTALGQDMPDRIGRPSMDGKMTGGEDGGGGMGLEGLKAAGGKFLKVGLAGAVGFGILSKLTKMADASPRMTKALSMISRAIRLFARPFYDWLAKTMEGGIMDLLGVATKFNKDYQQNGLKVAVQNLAEDTFGGGPPSLPDVSMPGFDFPSPEDMMDAVDSLEWDDFLVAIEWANFVTGVTLGQWVVELVWDQWVNTMTWDNFIVALEWLDWLSPLDWSGFIDYFDDWGRYLIPLAWDSFVDKLSWDAWVDFILWSDWIPGFSWSDWIDDLDWNVPGSRAVRGIIKNHVGDLDWNVPSARSILGKISDRISGGISLPSISFTASDITKLIKSAILGDEDDFSVTPRPVYDGHSPGRRRGETPDRPARFQHGGLVTSPTRALVGEAGPEVIAPFSKFIETMEEQRERGSGGGGDTPQSPAAGGSGGAREVVRAVKDLKDELQRLDLDGDVYLDNKKVGEVRRGHEQRYRSSRRVTK